MKSKKAKVQRFERFEELEFEECDFEWSTIVDNGIQKSKNPKIQKKIEGIRLAEMQKDAEGLNNDKGEFKKFKREGKRGRGEKGWIKALKSVFMGGIFVSVGDFSPPRRSLRCYLYLLDIYERSVCTSATADFEITSQTFSFSDRYTCQPAISVPTILGTGPPVPVPK